MRLVALLVLGAVGLGAVPGADDDVKAYLAREEATGFSGAVLVRDRGRTLVDRGYGLADRERRIDATAETVFEVGSITKVFTAATVMKLADEGRLRLDDRLPRFFRGVPADKRAITVRQLLGHRSGLPEYPGYGDHQRLTRAAALRNAFTLPLRFRPGKRAAYSNVGYNVLAAIVERASGQTFEAAVRQRVFGPAAMNDTGFYGDPRWKPAEVAVGYGNRMPRYGSGRNAPDALGPVSWSLKGAGGAASTTHDLVRWVDAVRGGRILRRASVPLLYRLAIGPGKGPIAYGGANMFGFQAVVTELPQRPAVIVVLTNSNVLPRFRADEIARELERRLSGNR